VIVSSEQPNVSIALDYVSTMVPDMPRNVITVALAAEAAALSEAASGLTDADLTRASPCPPWTVGELLCHVLIAVDRIRQALREPEVTGPGLIAAADYYRPDQRFSAATNADRIDTAKVLARRLASGGAAGIAAELDQRCAVSLGLLEAAPADRTVRTRHGDRMLLTDFARTRIVELAIHGLDLAAGLGRPPWLSSQAAAVVAELLLPAGGEAQLRAQLGCDRVGVVAALTGRAELSAGQAQLLQAAGVTVLTLG
jgi:uncharacterized protein (TIGR03083 family)